MRDGGCHLLVSCKCFNVRRTVKCCYTSCNGDTCQDFRCKASENKHGTGANKLWPSYETEFAACDSDPVIDGLTARHAVKCQN